MGAALERLAVCKKHIKGCEVTTTWETAKGTTNGITDTASISTAQSGAVYLGFTITNHGPNTAIFRIRLSNDGATFAFPTQLLDADGLPVFHSSGGIGVSPGHAVHYALTPAVDFGAWVAFDQVEVQLQSSGPATCDVVIVAK